MCRRAADREVGLLRGRGESRQADADTHHFERGILSLSYGPPLYVELRGGHAILTNRKLTDTLIALVEISNISTSHLQRQVEVIEVTKANLLAAVCSIMRACPSHDLLSC